MADENKIQVQIVFDDGSVQKGFVKMEQAAAKAAEKSTKEIKTIGDALDGKDIVGTFTDKIKSIPIAFGAAAVGVVAFGYAASKALDLILDGEKINKINSNFDQLAARAGQSADVLRDAFKDAAGGIVDDSDILESANKALINLGDSADKLPELFKIARKSSLVFGGDVTENFEKMSQAISSGSTKQLRALGIYIDAESAARKYADQLGINVKNLTDSEKKQAVLNEILEKGGNQFSAIAEKSNTATIANKKLDVATSDLGETFSVIMAKTFGPAYIAVMDSATGATNRFSAALLAMFGDGKKVKENRLIEVNAEIKKLKEQLANDNFDKFIVNAERAQKRLELFKREAESLTGELERFKTKSFQDIVADDSKKAAARLGEIPDRVADAMRRIDDQNKTLRDTDIEIMRSKANTFEFEASLAQRRLGLSETQANIDAVITAKRLAEDEKYKVERLALEKQYTDRDLQTSQVYQDLQAQKLLEHNQRKLNIDYEYNREKQIANEVARADAITTAQAFENIMDGFSLGAQELALQAEKSFKQIGKSMLNGLGNAAGQAFAAFGAALAKGENGLAAFLDSFVKSFGQMAVQLGTQFILTGAAYLFSGIPDLEAKAVPLMSAGAALAAFGGILSAFSGGGASAGAGASDGGGISSGVSAPIADNNLNLEDAADRKPQTKVEFIINGSVFDTKDTGDRLFDIFQSKFDTDGSVLVGRTI